jgi:hypothetical protein
MSFKAIFATVAFIILLTDASNTKAQQYGVPGQIVSNGVSSACNTDSTKTPAVTLCNFQLASPPVNNSYTVLDYSYNVDLLNYVIVQQGAFDIDNLQPASMGAGRICYVSVVGIALGVLRPICQENQINGLMTLTDTNAGEKISLGQNYIINYAGAITRCSANSPTQFQPTLLVLEMAGQRMNTNSSFILNLLPNGETACNLPFDPGGFTEVGDNSVTFCAHPPNCNLPTETPDAIATFKYVIGSPPWTTPEFKQAITNLGIGVTVLSAVSATIALKRPQALIAIPTVAAGISYSGLGTALASGVDPPDPNYTTVVTPTFPSIDLTGVPPAASQVIQTAEQIIGFSNAVYTTANRATGALLNGDTTSQQLQLAALPGFESQLATAAAPLPAQFAAWGQELLSEGVDPRTIALSDVTAALQSISANGFPSSIQSALTSLGADPTAIQQAQTLVGGADPAQVEAVLQNVLKIGPLMPPVLPASSNLQQFGAVLPASRSAVVGNPVTAFATIINAGTSTAHSCGIAPDTPLPISFSYQTTNPATNALAGSLDTPVDIPAGGAQSFVVAVTPTSAFPTAYMDFLFFCADANPAPETLGVDTLALSGSTSPVPDVVALAASGDPGIVDVSSTTNAGAFAVATVNLGSDDNITATTNTNGTTLPISINVCQTVPATGACMSPPAASVTTDIQPDATPTFGIFVSGTGSVPFDPSNNRVFVQFTDSGGVVRGATSVAVRTQ